MKKSPMLFLQAVIVLIGIAAVAFLLWEPHLEGRNAHATLFQIYFNDPFLAYAYVAAIPFFLALYQGIKLLGYAGQSRPFSPQAAHALRTIKLCALTIIAFVAGGEIIILLNDSDDRTGGFFMGALIGLGAAVTAAAAMVLEDILRNASAMNSP